MKFNRVLLTALALLLFAGSTTATYWEVFGAVANKTNAGLVGLRYTDGSQDYWSAQPFKFSGDSREVEGIQIKLFNVFTGLIRQLHLSIWTGASEPTAMFNASAYGVNTSSLTLGDWNNVTLITPITLTAGTQYWLVARDSNALVGYASATWTYTQSGGSTGVGNELMVAWNALGAPRTWGTSGYPGNNLTIGYAYNIANVVLAVSPENTTYYSNTVNYNFSSTQDGYCGYWLDGALTWIGFVPGGDYSSGALIVTPQPNYNFTAFCGDASNSTDTVFFSVNYTGLIDSTVERFPFEVNYYDLNASIKINTAEVVAATLNFTINGTTFDADYSSAFGENMEFGYTQLTPFIQVNGSNSSVAFNLTIEYNNATTQTINFSNGTQTVLFGVYAKNLTATPDSQLSGENINFNASIANYSELIASTIWLEFNGTNQSMTQSGAYWFDDRTAPTVVGSEVFNASVWVNASHGGATYTRAFAPINVTVYYLNISWTTTTCSAGYYAGLNLSFYNEEDTTKRVNTDLSATFTAWNPARTLNANATVNATNQKYVVICFSPDTINYSVDSFQIYVATGYNPRAYFLLNASVNSAEIQNVSLFLANKTITKDTKVVVRDESGLALKNAYVIAQRYYPEKNDYLGVAMILTDDVNGEGLTYLTPNDVFYRFVVVKDFRVLQTFSSKQVICDPGATQCVVSLRIGAGAPGEYWNYVGKIAHSCNFNASTNFLICTVLDTSGLFQTFNLTVQKLGIKQHTTVCTDSSYSASTTLTCNLTAFDDGQYSYNLIAYGSNYLIASENFVKGAITALFGTNTPLLALILIPTIAFAVGAEASTIVFFLGIGLVAATFMGLLIIDAAAVAAIIAAGVIIAWKLKKKW